MSLRSDDRLQIWAASISLFFISILLHILPFVLYGGNPLGYDTGFYRRYLTQPFISFPNSPVPGLGGDALVPRILLDALRLAHVPTDIALYGSYILFFAILPVALYLFLRRSAGTRAAYIAGLFIIASSVSYEAYSYMLYKNALCLDLILFAFLAFERRARFANCVLDVAIALSHTTSAVIYLLALCGLFVISPGRRREIAGHIALTAVPFALVNISLVHEAAIALPTAVFIEWSQYLPFSAAFIVLLAFGWKELRERSVPRTLIAFTAVSFAFPVLHLPFYERVFVFCDVALAALAAYAADHLLRRCAAGISRATYLWLCVLCVSCGLLLGELYHQILTQQPLMSEPSIQEIAQIGESVPSDAFILTSANEAPWYEGWTLSHIAAPGLLYDDHNLDEWTAFWDSTSTPDRIAFLSSFPQPLYISTLFDPSDLLGSSAIPCLIPVTPHLLYDACPLTKQ